MAKLLEELRDKIREEAIYVNRKPYSHNIVGLLLGQIDSQYGQEEANKAILDFGLDMLGWSVVE